MRKNIYILHFALEISIYLRYTIDDEKQNNNGCKNMAPVDKNIIVYYK